MATRYTHFLGVLMLVASAISAMAHTANAVPRDVDCIVPAQSGGGFDLTCRFLSQALAPDGIDVTRVLLPGGVGAVAFNTILNERADDPSALVAFSDGSIYNLALGHYGAHGLDDVRWLAVLGLDYGAVLVRADAPWTDLQSLLTDARNRPQSIAFAGGGGIGGQDWSRAVTTADLANIDRNRLRYVALEGGGNCIDALLAGFVQVCMNDVGDGQRAIENGAALKMLAVYAPHRLDDALADIPTAREQGLALDWPIIRGVYTGKQVDPAIVSDWENVLRQKMETPEYKSLLRQYHLHPLSLTGDALHARLSDLVNDAKERAVGLNRP